MTERELKEGGGMANLSSLVNELRERIAASSSTPSPSNGEEDDALEMRFRAVLPNLLHAYVVPSSSGTYVCTSIYLSIYIYAYSCVCNTVVFLNFNLIILQGLNDS